MTFRLPTISIVLVSALAVVMTPTGALSDPEPPDNASNAVRELGELSARAEQLTEQWHAAQAEVDNRRAELTREKSRTAAAREAARAAQTQVDSYQPRVDELLTATYKGVEPNQLLTLTSSDSPRQYLQRASALGMIADERRRIIDGLRDALARRRAAEQQADEARAKAEAAERTAAEAERTLAADRREMDGQITVVRRRLNGLSPADRATYTGGGQTDYRIEGGVGDSVPARAMKVALSQQGKPYVWGAAGPGSFDCSGLLLYSYKTVGASLPRPSREQARVGSPVTRATLRPGDLIAYYSPVSHIGIYVGNDKMVHAPQSGDVVKVSAVSWKNVTAMRRPG